MVGRGSGHRSRGLGLSGGEAHRAFARVQGETWTTLGPAVRTWLRMQSAKADFGPLLPRLQSPQRAPALAPMLIAAPHPEVYPLSHAVCGRGWTSLSEDG
jgi:hypothetical protein